jgi:hypothetical protein
MPTVKVTLDETTTPWTIVLDTNPIVIPRNSNAQSIHWHLAGNAYGGQFKSLTGSPPPFQWNGVPPPAGTFEDPTLSPQKKALTIKDNNKSAANKGEWGYTLCIVVGGTTYKTNLKKVKATSAKVSGGMSITGSGNPTIRNN